MPWPMNDTGPLPIQPSPKPASVASSRPRWYGSCQGVPGTSSPSTSARICSQTRSADASGSSSGPIANVRVASAR